MSPWALLGGVLVAVGALGGSYLQGRADGRNSEIAEHATQAQLVAAAGEEAASAAAAAIAKLEVKHVTVRQQLEREVLEREVYRTCDSGPDAVRLFNSTIPGAAASEPPGDGSVP